MTELLIMLAAFTGAVTVLIFKHIQMQNLEDKYSDRLIELDSQITYIGEKLAKAEQELRSKRIERAQLIRESNDIKKDSIQMADALEKISSKKYLQIGQLGAPHVDFMKPWVVAENGLKGIKHWKQ